MRFKNKRDAAPTAQPEQGLDPALATDSATPPATLGADESHTRPLPALPRLASGDERPIVRTNDEVHEQARARGIALLASRDALSDPALHYRYSKQVAHTADVLAIALGFPELCLAPDLAKDTWAPLGRGTRMASADDTRTGGDTASGKGRLTLVPPDASPEGNTDATALLLPSVPSTTIYDTLVIETGFAPVTVQHLINRPLTEAQKTLTEPAPVFPVTIENPTEASVTAPYGADEVDPSVESGLESDPAIHVPFADMAADMATDMATGLVEAMTEPQWAPVLHHEPDPDPADALAALKSLDAVNAVESEPIWVDADAPVTIEPTAEPVTLDLVPAGTEVVGSEDVEDEFTTEVSIPPADMDEPEPVWAVVDADAPVAVEPVAFEPVIVQPLIGEAVETVQAVQGPEAEPNPDAAGGVVASADEVEPVWAVIESDEPVWQDTNAAPLSLAEQDALNSLMSDLRAFTDTSVVPPVPSAAPVPPVEDEPQD